jgi:hypothetical protein
VADMIPLLRPPGAGVRWTCYCRTGNHRECRWCPSTGPGGLRRTMSLDSPA